MQVEGYMGICAACFEPIKNGEGIELRPKGRHFHKKCVEENPNNYYVKLERRLTKAIKAKKSKRAVRE